MADFLQRLDFNSPPRGDENAAFALGLGLVHPDFNSPPRGDENAVIPYVEGGDLHQFQLTPARGRKPRAVDTCSRERTISTHPREGTKTQ